MYKKYFALLLMIVCIGLLLTACTDDIFSVMSKWVEATVNYEYEITVAYENLSDRSSFEKRINSLKLAITEAVEEDNKVTYTLRSHSSIEIKVLQLLSEPSTVSVVDADGNPVITLEDIVSVSFDGNSVDIVTSSEFFAEFDKKFDSRTIRLLLNQVDVNALFSLDSEREVMFFMMAPNEDVTLLAKAAIALASEPLNGAVEIQVNPLKEGT